MEGKKLRDLKPGEWFTLKPVEHPKECQVYIKSGYDRSVKKYWATKWADIGDGKNISGDKIVFVDFFF